MKKTLTVWRPDDLTNSPRFLCRTRESCRYGPENPVNWRIGLISAAVSLTQTHSVVMEHSADAPTHSLTLTHPVTVKHHGAARGLLRALTWTRCGQSLVVTQLSAWVCIWTGTVHFSRHIEYECYIAHCCRATTFISCETTHRQHAHTHTHTHTHVHKTMATVKTAQQTPAVTMFKCSSVTQELTKCLFAYCWTTHL